MKHVFISIMTLVVLACGGASDSGINKSIVVAAGEHKSGSLRTVNGSITLGKDAGVEGNCVTVNGHIVVGENAFVREISCVNGGIRLDNGSRAEEISCVNGSIALSAEVQIEGDVTTVNGTISSKRETQIAGDMGTVNGDMYVRETLIGGDITTVNGNIELLENSQVNGNIIIHRNKRKPGFKQFKELTITVASGSRVKGNVEVKGDDPNVTVILAGDGEVLGEIINAEVIRK